MPGGGDFKVGDLVCSLAGRDKDRCYLVWSVREDAFLELVDGRNRRVENPKRKNPKHVRKLNCTAWELAEKIKEGKQPSNGEIRKAILELGVDPGGRWCNDKEVGT